MDFELDLRLGVPPLVNLVHRFFNSEHCSNPTLTVAFQVATICLLLLLGSLVRLPLNVVVRPFRPRLWDFNFSVILLFVLLASLFLPPDAFWYAFLTILVGSSRWSRRLLEVLGRYLISLHTYLAALVTGTENHQIEQSTAGQGPILEVQLNEDDDFSSDMYFGHA